MSKAGKTELEKLIKRISGRRTAVIPHRDADPDALASAVIIRKFLGHMGIDTDIVAPSRNRFTRGIEPFVRPYTDRTDDVESYLVVDTSAPNMLPPAVSIPDDADILVIDHHKDLGDWKDTAMSIIRQRPSNVEVIFELFEESEIDYRKFLERNDIILALVAIHYDTASFRFSVPGTFKLVYELTFGFDINVRELSHYIQAPFNKGERIAVFKSFQRLRWHEHKRWFIGTSVVGAFEATSARKLVDSGLDVSFVGSRDSKSNVRVASRASEEFMRCGGDLTQIIDVVKKDFELQGGGHKGAAGMTGTGDVEAILNALTDGTMRHIEKMRPPKGRK